MIYIPTKEEKQKALDFIQRLTQQGLQVVFSFALESPTDNEVYMPELLAMFHKVAQVHNGLDVASLLTWYSVFTVVMDSQDIQPDEKLRKLENIRRILHNAAPSTEADELKPTSKTEMVVAHQLLAAARIIDEQLTALGYDDQFAEREYQAFKIHGMDDQSAIRMIAAAVNQYQPEPSRYGAICKRVIGGKQCNMVHYGSTVEEAFTNSLQCNHVPQREQ